MLIKGDLSGDPWEVLRCCDGGVYLGRIGRAGAFHGIGQNA